MLHSGRYYLKVLQTIFLLQRQYPSSRIMVRNFGMISYELNICTRSLKKRPKTGAFAKPKPFTSLSSNVNNNFTNVVSAFRSSLSFGLFVIGGVYYRGDIS